MSRDLGALHRAQTDVPASPAWKTTRDSRPVRDVIADATARVNRPGPARLAYDELACGHVQACQRTPGGRLFSHAEVCRQCEAPR